MDTDDRTRSFLSQGTDTFTLDRLHAILQNERFSYDHRTDTKDRPFNGIIYGPLQMRGEINTDFFGFETVNDGIRCFNKKDCILRATEFCKDFYGHDARVSISVTRLDDVFSRVFKFKFEPLENSQTVVEEAAKILERVPAWPLELNDIPAHVPPEYEDASLTNTMDKDTKLWEQLRATTFVSTVVLRVALWAVIDPGCLPSLLDMTNIVAALLEIVSQLKSTSFDIETSWRSFIARAFLWTTWQRCQLLYFYIVAGNALVEGSPDGKIGQLALRGTYPSPGVTTHEFSKQVASKQKPAYMCGWSFELLRAKAVCVGADFRRFHRLYNTAFGAYPPRCFVGKSEACKGDSTKSCQRFQGMVVQDQSAHDQSCPKTCEQLIWDETSYRDVSGARSVSITQNERSPGKLLQYCKASDQTLAISHVWSQ